MTGVNLHESNLVSVNFMFATLHQAQLEKTNVGNAVFAWADLRDANFEQSYTRVAFKRVGVITLKPLSTNVFRIMWSL